MRRSLLLGSILLFACGVPRPIPPRHTPAVAPASARAVEPRFHRLAVGAAHACVIDEGASVLCWGEGSRGQLGNGRAEARSVPARVPDLEAVSIAATASSTCAIDREGAVWCWGAGALGSELAVAALPVRVEGVSRARALEAEGSLVCALEDGGDVWCWGAAGDARLPRPTRVSAISPARELAITPLQACARDDGYVCADLSRDVRAPLREGAARSIVGGCAALEDGSVVCGDRRVAEDVPDDAELRDGCIQPREGAPLCWSWPMQALEHEAAGNLWRIEELRGAAEIDTSGSLGCALLDDGSVRCWGDGSLGQLGDGRDLSRVARVHRIEGVRDADVLACAGRTCCARRRADAWCWAIGDRPPTVVRVDHVVELRASENAGVCARRSDRSVTCWAAIDGETLTQTAMPLEGSLAPAGRHLCAESTEGIRCLASASSEPLLLDASEGREPLISAGSWVCRAPSMRCWNPDAAGARMVPLERTDERDTAHLVCVEEARSLRCAPTTLPWLGQAIARYAIVDRLPEPSTPCRLDRGGVRCTFGDAAVDPPIVELSQPFDGLSAEVACGAARDGSIACFAEPPRALEASTVTLEVPDAPPRGSVQPAPFTCESAAIALGEPRAPVTRCVRMGAAEVYAVTIGGGPRRVIAVRDGAVVTERGEAAAARYLRSAGLLDRDVTFGDLVAVLEAFGAIPAEMSIDDAREIPGAGRPGFDARQWRLVLYGLDGSTALRATLSRDREGRLTWELARREPGATWDVTERRPLE